LYKEDFEKFGSALTEAIDIIQKLQSNNSTDGSVENKDFSDISFEELGSSTDG
jgi:hypothetical protein